MATGSRAGHRGESGARADEGSRNPSARRICSLGDGRDRDCSAAPRAHPLAEAPAHGGRPRRDRGRAEPARLGRSRVVRRALGHDDRDLARVPRRRPGRPDGADDAHRLRLAPDSPVRLSGRRDPVPAGARLLRGRRRAERLPAGEHRHLRDDVPLPHLHPRVDLSGRLRGLARSQDLLHASRVASSTSTSSSPCPARSTSSSATSRATLS